MLYELTTCHVIRYGRWDGNNSPFIVNNMLKSLGSSSWWSIMRSYGVRGSLTAAKYVFDRYSQGGILKVRILQESVKRSSSLERTLYSWTLFFACPHESVKPYRTKIVRSEVASDRPQSESFSAVHLKSVRDTSKSVRTNTSL